MSAAKRVCATCLWWHAVGHEKLPAEGRCLSLPSFSARGYRTKPADTCDDWRGPYPWPVTQSTCGDAS